MSVDYSDLRATEQRNPRTQSIDLLSAGEIVKLMIEEDGVINSVVASVHSEIANAVSLVEQAFRSGGRLIWVGAGTSGRLGVLDASECPPTFGSDPNMVVGVIAGGDIALRNSVEGAEDDRSDGALQMDLLDVSENDVIAGIAASGSTPFVHAALQRAHARGAHTVLISCSKVSDEANAYVDNAIVAVTGPEVITGSTRLKAGTATKMILNIISTSAFVRIGKTWSNLMVDMRPVNAKLVDRSERILMEICSVERSTARQLLHLSNGDVKIALVMQELSCDVDMARERLLNSGGVIRRALL